MNKILPLFLHHMGCPHRCSYCNQSILNGTKKNKTIAECRAYICAILEENPGRSFDLAFYGASFTNMDLAIQKAYLDLITEYPQLEKIILSTRPDGLSKAAVNQLKKYPILGIEIGVESLNRKTLNTINRNYTKEQVFDAIELCRQENIDLSAHLMIGLPFQTREGAREDLLTLINKGVKKVRIHPTIILKNTELEKMYRQEDFTPWTLEESIDCCADLLELCNQKDVKVLRLGLQPTSTLLESGNIIAGPYHPAFGELCFNRIYRRILEKEVKQNPGGNFIISYPQKIESKLIGQHRSNITYLQKKYPKCHLHFDRDTNSEQILTIKEASL